MAISVSPSNTLINGENNVSIGFSHIFKLVSRDRDQGILIYKTIDITYKKFLSLLRKDEIIQKEFVKLLLNLPFDAIYFESQPVTKSKLNDEKNTHEFHFAIINAPNLATFARIGNYEAFANHLKASSCNYKNNDNDNIDINNNDRKNIEDSSISFNNLGGDAKLIIPCPITGKNDNFGHLLSFLRTASSVTITNILERISIETLSLIENKEEEDNSTVWLSTCGTGVPWLHFRLDSRPKYYSYEPFKNVQWKPSIS